MNWYNFTGSNPANPEHYELETGTPLCTGAQQQLCAIQANEGTIADTPDLDNSILSEMVQALNAPGNTTNVRLKSR